MHFFVAIFLFTVFVLSMDSLKNAFLLVFAFSASEVQIAMQYSVVSADIASLPSVQGKIQKKSVSALLLLGARCLLLRGTFFTHFSLGIDLMLRCFLV